MERAYSIAEAGIDRGVAEVDNDRDLANSRTNTEELEPPYLLWQRSEEFPGDEHGEYDVSIYYDTSNPTETGGTDGPWTGDPSYKRIMSTGTYTSGVKSVERTIEIKAYIPAFEQESYDEAFDYCIFNGFNARSDESGIWPSDDDNNPAPFSAGQFTFDGSTPYGGHAPKGALYTRGDLQLTMTGLDGSSDERNTVTVKGNVVATGDITVTNTESSYSDMIVGEDIDDKVVAGLDGTGKVTVNAVGALGLLERTQKVDINATLCAAGDIDIVGEYGLESYEIGDIKSGGNVTVSRAMNTPLAVGNVLSTGKTGVESLMAYQIVVNSIRAGEYEGDTTVWDVPGLRFRNVGVLLASAVCQSIQVTGISPYNDPGEEYSIISSGELVSVMGIGELEVGDIKVGYGHTLESWVGSPMPLPGPDKRVGVFITYAIGSFRAGNIQSTGRVDLAANLISGNLATGSITAGSDAYEGMPVGLVPVGVVWRAIVDTTYTNVISGPVTAVGDVNMLAVGCKGISIGDVLSGGNVDLESKENSFGRACSINTGTLSAAGYVSLSSLRGISIDNGGGTIYARGNVSFECETGDLTTTAVSGIWGQGVTVNRNSGTEDGLLIGTIPGIPYSIGATGDVSLTAPSGMSISLSDVLMHTGETYNKSGTVIGGTRVDYDALE
ncbi:MAG: hypothetical protein JJE48_10190, partial [Actinobacteria bacterium]|nr:hypothetical protein [Actinomycetota bacterium]